MARKIKTITLCSSASFYKEIIDVQKQLRKMGFKVLIPKTANIMKKKNDFDVTHYKTWLLNNSHYSKKRSLMDGHFRKVKKAEAILVVNHEKNGLKGYIGGNVLLEMFLAYLDKKPIFVLQNIDDNLPLKEEVLGLFPTFIQGDLEVIKGK